MVEAFGNQLVKMMRAGFSGDRIPAMRIESRHDPFLNILHNFFVFHFNFIQVTAGSFVIPVFFPHIGNKLNAGFVNTDGIHDIDR